MKEKKEAFHLFGGGFQFFTCSLAKWRVSAWQLDPYNLAKYIWRKFEGLEPLDITTATDMVADWELDGIVGGEK